MPVAAERLKPFFDPVAVRYPHYRYLGATKLIGEPIILLAALLLGLVVSEVVSPSTARELVTIAALASAATAGAIWGKGRLSSRGLAAAIATIMLAVVVATTSSGDALVLATFATYVFGGALAYVVGQVRLRSALQFVQSEFGKPGVRIPGMSPHLVGHSLGTYLSGTSLRDLDWAKFDRVVLCAAVLPRDYDWKALGTKKRVRAVRNETGLRDLVPKVAGMLSPLAPQFGSAGRDGFLDSEVVHTVKDAYDDCALCSGAPPVLVHNVPSAYTHSTYFISGAQCDDFWLPFFLGVPVGEFSDWLQYCLDASESFGRDDGNWVLMQALLLRQTWSWTRGTLASALERQLVDRCRIDHKYKPSATELEHLVEVAVMTLWRATEHAVKSPTNERSRLALNPSTAIAWAVRVAIKVYGIA
jgi:hypothetical protein